MDKKKKDNTKREHYVPRFYLEKFCNLSPSKKECKIWVFNKQSKKLPYSSDVKDTATGNYFYDFPIELVGEENHKIFDARLQYVESNIAPFYKKFEKRLFHILKLDDKKKYQIKVIKKAQKKDWSDILAVQVLRTPEFRNLQKEVKQKAENENIIPDILKPEINRLYDDNLIPIPHYNFFNKYFHNLSNVFLYHKWSIGVNQTDIPFYTSDHPVVKIPYFETGYASEKIEVLFPINRQIILILRDKKHPKSNQGDCKLVNLSEDEVNNFNKAQVYCSNQFIYCHENKFELAQKICKERPDICSKVKNRVKFIKE